MRKLTEQDVTDIIGWNTGGFTVEKARVKGGDCTDSDHYGIILAVNGLGHHVTWQYHLDEGLPQVYWGHYYLEDREAALKDYETRSQ